MPKRKTVEFTSRPVNRPGELVAAPASTSCKGAVRSESHSPQLPATCAGRSPHRPNDSRCQEITFREEERDACMRMHRLALHLAGVLSCSAALSALSLKSQLFLLVTLMNLVGGCIKLPWLTSWTALAQVWATSCRLALRMSDTWAWCKL